MKNEDLHPFAEMLPRLYELKNMTDLSHPDAYFKSFENRFTEGRTVLGHYQRLERQLSALDDDAWSDLKPRAAVVAHIRNRGRGWQALFDTLNEAKGYVYLKNGGCTGVAFIKRANKKTPDLVAVVSRQVVEIRASFVSS